MAVTLTRSFLKPGGDTLGGRLAGLKSVLAAVLSTLRDPRRDSANDPVHRARTILQSDPGPLEELEGQVQAEINKVLASVISEVPS